MKFPLNLLRLSIAIFILLSSLQVGAQSSLPPITDSIASNILNETRGIQVILPKDYKAGSTNRYEVVYILDGDWYYELVPFAYNFAESAGYVPKSMFVLIRNRIVDGKNLRGRDFSPTKIKEDSISGGAENFYDFLTKEVVPYIEKKYPVNGQRSLVGSSFSGLFSVYAFIKDPAFFQSFIASDPNINWDNYHVTGLAAKKLKNLPPSPGTLFVAGLTTSFDAMGIAKLDSVFKGEAPKSLHWKCIPYPNESHYSVQLKAFYDGFRFSHLGYGTRPPEFHPMNGRIESNTPFPIFFVNESTFARYTTNGATPDTTSKLMVMGETTPITAPAEIKVKIFGNRPSYNKQWTGNYSKGTIKPVSAARKSKEGLRYTVYNDGGDNLVKMNSAKATLSGNIDSSFKLNNVLKDPNSAGVIEGIIDVPSPGEYIFFVNGYDAVKLELAGTELFKVDSAQVAPSQSFVTTLVKGKYPIRMQMARKADAEPHFIIFQVKAENIKWWENVWKQY